MAHRTDPGHGSDDAVGGVHLKDKVKVVFLGHSYVRRLGEFVTSSVDPTVQRDFGLSNIFASEFSVSFQGYGGSHVRKMYEVASDVMRRYGQIDILVLCIGGNDIESWTDPQRLACHIFALAEYFHVGHGIEQVVISSLMPRERARCSNFIDLVYLVNGELKERAKRYEEGGIVTWLHRGFAEPNVRQGLMLSDGVHLNHAGNTKYYKSLKTCLVQATKRLHSEREA